MEFFVLEAVSDIEVSEFLGACLVIEDKAGPHYRANCNNFIIMVLSALDGPQTAGLVINN